MVSKSKSNVYWHNNAEHAWPTCTNTTGTQSAKKGEQKELRKEINRTHDNTHKLFYACGIYPTISLGVSWQLTETPICMYMTSRALLSMLQYIYIYVCVCVCACVCVVIYTLAQASDLYSGAGKRFSNWKETSGLPLPNAGFEAGKSQTPIRQQTKCPLTNQLSYRGSS